MEMRLSLIYEIELIMVRPRIQIFPTTHWCVLHQLFSLISVIRQFSLLNYKYSNSLKSQLSCNNTNTYPPCLNCRGQGYLLREARNHKPWVQGTEYLSQTKEHGWIMDLYLIYIYTFIVYCYIEKAKYYK